MRRRGRPPYPDVLTPLEWEVLGLLREGLSNEEIAERLGITLRTAKFHVSEILSKLAVESREQAAAWQPGEAPAPTRRWLAWPLVARVAGAVVIVAAVVGLGLLAWGVLRTAEDGADSLPTDPEGLVETAFKRMESLDSYQLSVVDSEVEGSATVEVTRGGLVAVRTTIVTPSDVKGEWVRESIYETSAWYDRLCQDYPVSCGPGSRPARRDRRRQCWCRPWNPCRLRTGRSSCWSTRAMCASCRRIVQAQKWSR